jgi:thioredoxin-dependent peroxiredoxin
VDERSAHSVRAVISRGGLLRIFAPMVVIGLIIVGLGAFYLNRHATAPVLPLPHKRDLAQEARDDLEHRHFRPLSAPLAVLLADSKYEPIPTQAHSLLLQRAPDFTLRDVSGKEVSLANELQEGPVVLIFYYGYHCDHCVSQLFALDKDQAKFRELGAKVLAISADPVELTRERFKKYGAFGFPVLADPGNKVAEKYETYVPSAKAGQEGDLLHGTFVISRQGRIVWTNRGEGPFTENRSLLHEIARVEKLLPTKNSPGR